MKIKTKFNIGAFVKYDNGKRGKIIGYEIRNLKDSKLTLNGIWYEIEAMTYSEQVILDNYGKMRKEEDLEIFDS